MDRARRSMDGQWVVRVPFSRFLYATLLVILILYIVTLARSLVLGDPSEYTLVANILGIAHPPGYAFYTLLGKLFQTIIPFATIPVRMHLLSAVSATLSHGAGSTLSTSASTTP